jgi:hypothetical protein
MHVLRPGDRSSCLFGSLEDRRDELALNFGLPCRYWIATTPQDPGYGVVRFILACHGQGSKGLVLQSFKGAVQGYGDITPFVTMMTCLRAR